MSVYALSHPANHGRTGSCLVAAERHLPPALMDSRKYLFHPNDSMALHSFAQAMSKRRLDPSGTASSSKSEFYQGDDVTPFYISASVATSIRPTVVDVIPQSQLQRQLQKQQRTSSCYYNYNEDRTRLNELAAGGTSSDSDSCDSEDSRGGNSSCSPEGVVFDDRMCQQLSLSTANSCLVGTAESNNSCTGRSQKDRPIKILVQEARLDLQKLVEGKSQGKLSSSSRQASSSSPKRTGCLQIPRRRLRQKCPRKRSSFVTGHPASSTTDTSGWMQEQRKSAAAPHEEAIEFQLNISFAGRTYQAQRTFLKLVQLRNELIQEHQQQQESGDCSAVSAVALPDLPSLWEEDGCGACSVGLTRMNRALLLYRPVLETWFREVMEVLPLCSRVWADFLWEPMLPNYRDDANRLEAILEQDEEEKVV